MSSARAYLEGRLLSTAIVANRLGLSPRTVRLWAECGQLPAIKVGRQWRIAEAAFQAWFQKQTQSGLGFSETAANSAIGSRTV